ncbi:MAG: hypothetical protein ACHREM_14510 [Polyangiales bacterium]
MPPVPADRVESLEAKEGVVTGVVVIASPPWEKAATRTRSIDATLSGPLLDLAQKLGLTLSAAPSRYAFPRVGAALKSEDGGLVYDIGGRIEGELIVPSRPAPVASRRPRPNDR